ncbi:MAG: nodulation protein NfeD [Chloroflexi bacterium]|nr:nodulation protein NfeD [Chloroflexota bacterium]
MKSLRVFLLTFVLLAVFSSRIHAQSGRPLVVTLDVDGIIMPAMQEYIERGIRTAEQDDAEALIIRLDTPGGDLMSTLEIIKAIRASRVPVIVFVGPNGAIAGSAGALITISGHAAGMAPETAIGASTPISGSGEDLTSDERNKAVEISKAAIRPYVEPRGEEAVKLAEAMIDVAKAVTAKEALDAKLIDFIADDTDDLLEKLDGFTVQMSNGPRTLNTADAQTESLPMNFIEELLMVLTNPIIVLTLLGVGVQALLIEISSPGGWVAGFIGVVCLALGGYGLGILPVNWFGIIFLITAFVLFILDVKAPTHGALTAAGIASFIVGGLVLFNSPGTPDFARVSIPGVILLAAILGGTFAVIVGFGVRALRTPIRAGVESLAGKTGTARAWSEASGQVQLESELWSAEAVEGSDAIRKGDAVEVVEVKGLRLKVKKR